MRKQRHTHGAACLHARNPVGKPGAAACIQTKSPPHLCSQVPTKAPRSLHTQTSQVQEGATAFTARTSTGASRLREPQLALPVREDVRMDLELGTGPGQVRDRLEAGRGCNDVWKAWGNGHGAVALSQLAQAPQGPCRST